MILCPSSVVCRPSCVVNNLLKHIIFRNYWYESNQILHRCSKVRYFTMKCSNGSIPWRTLVAMTTERKIFENLLLQNLWPDLNDIRQGWYLSDPLPRLLNHEISKQNMAARVRSQFSLYMTIYIENFTNLFPLNHLSDLHTIWQI